MTDLPPNAYQVAEERRALMVRHGSFEWVAPKPRLATRKDGTRFLYLRARIIGHGMHSFKVWSE